MLCLGGQCASLLLDGVETTLELIAWPDNEVGYVSLSHLLGNTSIFASHAVTNSTSLETLHGAGLQQLPR